MVGFNITPKKFTDFKQAYQNIIKKPKDDGDNLGLDGIDIKFH